VKIIKNKIRHCLLVISFNLCPPVMAVSVPQWQIIPTESQLMFTATQNGAPVTGEFKLFTGTLLVDPNDLKSSSIDIIVDINSLSVSYAELKTTLISSDWFNTKLFSQAEFKSSHIEKTGEKSYQAKGMLTIRDKSQPVILNFSAELPNPDKGIVTGDAVIKRTLFGVGQGEWGSTDEIKDEVTVHFKVVGIKEKSK